MLPTISETAIKIQGKVDPNVLYLQFADKEGSGATTFKLPVKTYISLDGKGTCSRKCG